MPLCKSRIREFLPSVSPEAEGRFFDRICYLALDYEQQSHYIRLARNLDEGAQGTPVLFYLDFPQPFIRQFCIIWITQEFCMNPPEKGKRRIIFEKPFGFSLAEFFILESEVRLHLKEEQIYHIDHYLYGFRNEN